MPKNSEPVSYDLNPEMVSEAFTLYQSGKYKEAANSFKKLLQVSGDSEWRQQLADCYLQRAMELANKGLYKEALVLWDNYTQQLPPPYPNYDHYLTWLLHTQNQTKILAALGQLSSAQLDKQFPKLAALLGLLIINRCPQYQHALPQDSVFIAHLKIVQTALAAYQNKDLQAAAMALQQLPYRSAFRDLRSLFKASLAASASCSDAQAGLAKIPVDSVYAPAAKLLSACTQSGQHLAHAIQTLTAQQCRLVGEIVGLTGQELELLSQINKHRDSLPDKTTFNLAIQYKALFGNDLAQLFCLGLLPDYPAGQRDYNKNFNGLTDFDEMRLHAIACERSGRDYDARYYWQQAIRNLSADGADQALAIALILRHLAKTSPDQEKIEFLIESLDHDPDDKDCYLEILNYYQHQAGQSQAYQAWLHKALSKFAQDIDLLGHGVQAALEDNDYPKADQYAVEMLSIDPLNAFAKQTLWSNYRIQARLAIQNKNADLAEHYLQLLENLKMGQTNNYQARLLRGFCWYSAHDKQQGLELIAEALGKLNKEVLNIHFQASAEAILTGQPTNTILRALPPTSGQLLTAHGLNRLIHLIADYAQEPGYIEAVHKALEKIKAVLKASVIQQNYPENLLLSLCQGLDEIQHFELLRHCSKWAHSQWQSPIWTYYKIYAETNNQPGQCSYQQVLSLQFSLEQARNDKDQRTELLIGEFLDSYHQTHPQSGMEFLDNMFEAKTEADLMDHMAELFDHLPDEVFYKLDKKVSALVKKLTPEQLLQEINKIYDTDKDSLQAMFQAMSGNPELFSALLVLKAADDLKIPTDVNLDDVLKAFDVPKKSAKFPF